MIGVRGACGLAMFGLMLSAVFFAGRADAAEGNREKFKVSKLVGERGMEQPDVPQPPQRDSPRGRALAALAAIEGPLTLYSLQPFVPPTSPPRRGAYGSPEYIAAEKRDDELWERSQREWCARDDCLASNKVLGKVAVNSKNDRAQVIKALRESLGKIPGYASSCLPEYRHSVAFVSGGHYYDVLLCYQCGQVRVIIDGDDEGGNGQTYSMGSQAALNAILRKAGIPLAKASWGPSKE